MNACAYVVGSREGSGAAVYELAAKLGFETIRPYRSVAEAERQADDTPLCFFFFTEVASVQRLASTVQAIRFSAGRPVRFSPLIYFCANPSIEVIRSCMGMGFDDVITQPYTAHRVAARLRRQIDTELVYFETSSYFGPDRRSGTDEPRDNDRRGDGQVRRLEIVRHFSTGVDVLRDDMQVVL